MKKTFNSIVIATILASASFTLISCSSSDAPENTNSESNQNNPVDINTLSSGNMLYILRDAADVQLKTGEYVEKLRLSQNELQQALETQDPDALKQSVTQLKQQLLQLNQKLATFNLKSQEVESVRREMAELNQQALKMPIFNEKLDLSKANFDALQDQLNDIQSDIVQVATMAIPSEVKDVLQVPSQSNEQQNNSDTDKE